MLQRFSLKRSQHRNRRIYAFAGHPRSHRRLGDIRGLADRAFHEPLIALLFIVGVRSKPGLERLAIIPALKVENDHRLTASGIVRRWFSAGIRERTSEM